MSAAFAYLNQQVGWISLVEQSMSNIAVDRAQGGPWIVAFAALSAFTCVGIGAFGAHGLPERLEEQGFTDAQIGKKLDQCEIGVRYQMFHSLALLALGLATTPGGRIPRTIPFVLFSAGIFMFSGNLYLLVFWDRMLHWSIIPLGGLLWMIGWFWLAIGALFSSKS
jgi:uncharacterized membrane protein YgdD (TMEM256/DUF423 family)